MQSKENTGALREMLASMFPERYKKKSVYIVHGAPGSGKTTYVQRRRSANDLVVDMDYLCAALNGSNSLYQNYESVLSVALKLRECVFAEIESRSGKWENAWVITASADKKEVADLARRLRGEVIPIDVSREQCIRNLLNDPRRSGHADRFVALANKWYDKNGL